MRIIKSGIIAGVVMLLIGTVFHLVIPQYFSVVSAAYTNKALFRPWGGWTRAYMLIHPLLFGFLFAGTYHLLVAPNRANGFLRGMRGGILYGTGVFLVGSLPIFALVYTSFLVPPQVVASWVVQNAFQYLAAGAVMAHWCDRH